MPISEVYGNPLDPGCLLDVEEVVDSEKRKERHDRELVELAWRAWLADRGWTEDHVTLSGFAIMLTPKKWEYAVDMEVRAFYRGFVAGMEESRTAERSETGDRMGTNDEWREAPANR